MRLQRFLSEAGVASRRGGEALISAGRVAVNGEPIAELGTKIDPERDEVRLDEKVLQLREKVYEALNKPRGCVCSRARRGGMRLVTDCLPRSLRHLYSVGRLDRESEGLIFLTNDGDFCLRVSHPRYGVEKRYWVTVRGVVTKEDLRRLRHGVVDRGERFRPKRARIIRTGSEQTVIEIVLNEGRNREIRRMLGGLGWGILRLCRARIGSVSLRGLSIGSWRYLSPDEVRALVGTGQALGSEN